MSSGDSTRSKSVEAQESLALSAAMEVVVGRRIREPTVDRHDRLLRREEETSVQEGIFVARTSCNTGGRRDGKLEEFARLHSSVTLVSMRIMPALNSIVSPLPCQMHSLTGRSHPDAPDEPDEPPRTFPYRLRSLKWPRHADEPL